MLYAACPESEVFIRGGGLGPLFLNFLDPPLLKPKRASSHNINEDVALILNLLN